MNEKLFDEARTHRKIGDTPPKNSQPEIKLVAVRKLQVVAALGTRWSQHLQRILNVLRRPT
jgi:hypothetical protein